jgi:hypothetical protein
VEGSIVYAQVQSMKVAEKEEGGGSIAGIPIRWWWWW